MVDDNGAVTPVGVGTCTVTATTLDGGLTAECAVTVGEHVAGVTLDKSEASVVGVGTTQLVATVSPAGALDRSVAWSTSDKSVATVNENGLVTAVGEGDGRHHGNLPRRRAAVCLLHGHGEQPR